MVSGEGESIIFSLSKEPNYTQEIQDGGESRQTLRVTKKTLILLFFLRKENENRPTVSKAPKKKRSFAEGQDLTTVMPEIPSMSTL